MCRLAVAQDDLFEVNDLEIQRGSASYTIDTVRELKASGWPEVNWLIGADQVSELPKWREAEALIIEANFVVMARPGYEIDWNQLPEAFRVLQNHVVEAPLVKISSTEIRRRVAAGESIDGLTPPAIVEYIKVHRLYQRS